VFIYGLYIITLTDLLTLVWIINRPILFFFELLAINNTHINITLTIQNISNILN
jgi:hypothetical protein